MANQNVVTLDNLGSGFDIGIAEPNKISVKGSALLWSGNFNEPDIHDNDQPVNIDEVRADSGWAKFGTNGMQYTGSPDHVEILGTHTTQSTGNYWAIPIIRVFRNGVLIGSGAAIHMDTNGTYNGHNSANIAFIDPSPGINPVYTFRSYEQDNRTLNDASIIAESPLTLKAVL